MRSRGRPLGSTDRRGHAYRVEDRARRMSSWRPMSRELGSRIRKIREERDIAVSELSEATGWSASTLLAWERGDRLPSLPGLLGLAIALRCSLVELLPDAAHHLPQPARTSEREERGSA